MALIRFFKVPRHSKFEHRPRYYDPAKEERESRYKKISEALQGDKEAIKTRMRSRMRRGYVDSSKMRTRSVRRSNLLLLAIIVMLGLFTYFFLQVQLPEIINRFYP